MTFLRNWATFFIGLYTRLRALRVARLEARRARRTHR